MQDIGNREQGQILPCSLIISLLFLIPAGGTSHNFIFAVFARLIISTCNAEEI
jgi:hypothetical protein